MAILKTPMSILYMDLLPMLLAVAHPILHAAWRLHQGGSLRCPSPDMEWTRRLRGIGSGRLEAERPEAQRAQGPKNWRHMCLKASCTGHRSPKSERPAS